MDGVIIQTEHVYREVPIAAAAIFVVVTICLLAWVAWTTINCFRNNTSDKWGVAAVLVFALAALFPANVAMMDGSCTTRSDLVITVDDSVGFNEFFDHYEIVNQDGKLYTVRELPIEETESEEAGDNE